MLDFSRKVEMVKLESGLCRDIYPERIDVINLSLTIKYCRKGTIFKKKYTALQQKPIYPVKYHILCYKHVAFRYIVGERTSKRFGESYNLPLLLTVIFRM